MYSRIVHSFLVVFLIVSLTGCDQSAKDGSRTADATAHILGSTGIFRGHEMGDSLQKVMRTDRDYLFKRSADELDYSIPFSLTDSAYMDVACIFEKRVLQEIQVVIYPLTEKDAREWFDKLRAELESRHGASRSKDNYAYWSLPRDGRHETEIILENQTKLQKRPYLSLNFSQPYSFNY